MPDHDTQTIGAVDRATSVLMLFAGTRARSLGVTEIANQLSLSKAVVHRVLASLRGADLIAFDEGTRRYSLGPATLTLGQAYLANLDLREAARPFMERLVEETGETVTLSIRHGDERVYIDQMMPLDEVAMTITLGHSYPLHTGSSSKAFLAFLPDAEQERLLSAEALAGVEPPIDVEELREELASIRKRGYARSFYARSVGARKASAASVAAPIFDHSGDPAAVMSVTGPVERFRQEADRAATALLQETRELSRRLGFQ